jgi:hypothetical protein
MGLGWHSSENAPLVEHIIAMRYANDSYHTGACLVCGVQVADVRAERDTLASQNATLAATTNQLMAAAAPAADASDAAPAAAAASSDGSSFGRSRSLSAPAAAAAADAPRISSAQLKEIGNMLARLTRENAALIKQRDKLQESLAPVTEEAQRASAVAEAAQRERDALLQGRAAARADADAAKAEAQRSSAAIRQMTAERERLQQLVGLPCISSGCSNHVVLQSVACFLCCRSLLKITCLNACLRTEALVVYMQLVLCECCCRLPRLQQSATAWPAKT